MVVHHFIYHHKYYAAQLRAPPDSLFNDAVRGWGILAVRTGIISAEISAQMFNPTSRAHLTEGLDENVIYCKNRGERHRFMNIIKPIANRKYHGLL